MPWTSSRRSFGAGMVSMLLWPRAAVADAPPRTFNVRDYGASPTASAPANTRAFQRASAALTQASGGTLLVPPGRYRVGTQRIAAGRGQGYAAQGQPIIHIENCALPVSIHGTGATLVAADGLRFGAFDPVTGAVHNPKLPFYDLDFRADAYRMIDVRNCRAAVTISGIELDGNADHYVLGGPWGDTGRQVEAIGIMLDRNTGGVVVENVRSHDHGLDGIMVAHAGLTAKSPRYPVTLRNVVCDRNGRQGLSWVGGTQLTAIGCRFTRTGRGRFQSAPGSGVDIEAEESVCRNGRFVDCTFSDNVGVGFLASTGDVADIHVERCRMIGTTSWSSWSYKPRIRFDDCLFVGSVVNAFPSPDPTQATQFHRCRFTDDPKLSPTGKAYHQFLADLGGGSTNVLFDDCDFIAVGADKALPWTPSDTHYNNCRFRQAGKKLAYTRGVFTGTCMFRTAGDVDFYGSKIKGSMTLNGRLLGRNS
ncbi:right-handed parallel beta-helix repeat-containing protein [Sphingomonas gellani]|nr:right-handed parallel beta-helix repeat-containing protein [Sphingomonas gellani]